MVCRKGDACGAPENETALIEIVEPVDVEIQAITNTTIDSRHFKDVVENAINQMQSAGW